MTQQIEIPVGVRDDLTCPFTRAPFVHVFDEEQVAAIRTASVLGRPLLVRGEPGAGKSQLARAVAACEGRELVQQVLDSDTRGQDLLYRMDLVRRLADAQMAGVMSPKDARVGVELKSYVTPSALWRGLNWNSAESIEPTGRGPLAPGSGPVLLLDEIDKADSTVPNGLLGALGDGRFQAPGHGWIPADPERQPFIVITTNEEQPMPRAFLRRCVVLHLELPSEQSELIQWLMKRGEAHFKDLDSEVLRMAAEQLTSDRERSRAAHLYAPGQAEYLDLLRVIRKIAGNDSKRQREVLSQSARFVLDKERAAQ